MTDLTSSSPMPENVRRHYECKLIHSRVPIFTGKSVYSETLKKMVPEIILVCKEGCGSKESKDE